MSSFDILALPEELSRAVVVRWLVLTNVFQLDSAFCNGMLRPQYYSLAYCQHTTFAMPNNRKTASIVRWSIARNAKVNGINLNSLSVIDQATRKKFLTTYRSWI
jgi:radical SAM superfamily enzyme